MTHHSCKTCGGLLAEASGVWKCNYCGNMYRDESVKREAEMLKGLFDEYKLERIANLRRNLYDAINAKYIDSEKIISVCEKIKEYLPDDFMANFYYTANRGTSKDICAVIRNTDEKEHAPYIDGMVAHIIKSMRSEYALPLQNLVERTYKNTDMSKFEILSTAVSDELENVNAGIYETSIPRDVFVAYSSKDMKKVEELVEFLEENSLDCFVASRNLRHGRGAVQNYEKALREAMNNCKWIVFVSSVNSRSMECDALKVELKHIKNYDIQNSPPEYRQEYTSIPDRYKKKRIEYRLDNEKTQFIAEKVLGEFFNGLEYALSPEEVLSRIYGVEDKTSATPEPDETASITSPPSAKEAMPPQPTVKKENKLVKAISKFFLPFTLSFNKGTNTYTIEKFKKTNAVVVEIPQYIDGKEVSEIGDCAFEGCTSLTKVILPDSIGLIGEKAFSGCSNLRSINLDQVVDIGEDAFRNCSCLKNINLSPEAIMIRQYAFCGCSSLTYITIPENLLSLEKSAFAKCSSLKDVVFVKRFLGGIENFTFCECSSLESIIIPDGVNTIGVSAFAYCSFLRHISLPDSLELINNMAFIGCSSLTSITFRGTKAQWNSITQGVDWNENCPTVTVTCTDGSVVIY